MKGLAASIGFASESMSAQKTHSHPEDEDEQHEEDWYLDEAQDQLIEHEQGYPEIKAESESRSWDIDKLVESFIRNHPPPAPSSGASLPYPVILPQRRPSSRRRGFIRAYAPVLADCGIDQATFLDFLDTAERAGQARPWLYAINLASFGTAMLPSGISIATSIAVQLAVKMAMEVEGRRRRVLSIKYGSIWDEMLMIKRTNTSLDRLNDGFFRPRGLYCLVMTYKPETPSPYATFDLHSVIDPSIDDREAGILEKFRAKYQRSDGTTHGVPFPETAPLAFPELDNLQDRGDPGLKLSGGLRGKKEFLANYLDKRAQAQFVRHCRHHTSLDISNEVYRQRITQIVPWPRARSLRSLRDTQTLRTHRTKGRWWLLYLGAMYRGTSFFLEAQRDVHVVMRSQ